MVVGTSFGEWLKHHRKVLGLTQEQLARQVSCSTITLRKIESEERRPSTQIIEKLAEALDIPEKERPAFLKFARGDWKTRPGKGINDEPWHATSTVARTNLPLSVTSLIGRTQAIASLREYLLNPEIRLVTLIGPPGIGKTRLGIETARQLLSDFSEGIFFVSLAPLSNSSLVATTILRMLGFVDKKNRSAFEMLKDGIGDKHILLILDNCEHVVEEVAMLVSELLLTCPRLKILTTSRESLRVSGEWLYTVPALDIPQTDSKLDMEVVAQFPALILFTERARAVRPDFALNAENVQAVTSICSRLDGLPLAIELIASRMRMTSPQSLLKHMDDQFVLTSDGMRSLSTRQKTLRDAINWSYDFLSPEDQILFIYLSVFSGGFTLEAAESIFGKMISNKTVTDIVTSLSDKSLLLRTTNEDSALRFHMLFTILQFARDHLHKRNEEAKIRNAHLAYFLNLASLAEQEIHGTHQIYWLHQLDQENDNFRSALEWCFSREETKSALQLISALSWVWGLWHHNSEIRNWFNKLQALPRLKEYPLLYAQLLNRVGQSNWIAGDFQSARLVLEESLSIWKELGNMGLSGMAEARCYLGMVTHSIDADYETAQSLFEESLAFYQDSGDRWGMALVLFNLGWVHDHKDNDETAQKYLEQSLEIFSELGDYWGMARSSQLLGQLFLKQGRYSLAERYFKQHLTIDESLQFKPGIVVALGNLGDLYRFQEEYDQAESYYLRSLSVCREYALKIDRGYNYYALGMLGLQKKDYAFASKYIKQYFESGSPVSLILATCDLCLGLSAAAGGLHQPERSARLYGAAQRLLQIIDIPYTPFDRAIFDRHIQIARDELGASMFEMWVQEGRAMTMEESIAYALRTSS